MSDITMIKPPRIGVASEASAQSKIVGPTRTDGKPATAAKAVPAPNMRRAGGHFGGSGNVQINRRGEAPITKLELQTLTVLRSTLGNLIRFCRSAGAKDALATAQATLELVNTIAAGESIADRTPPAPAASPKVRT